MSERQSAAAESSLGAASLWRAWAGTAALTILAGCASLSEPAVSSAAGPISIAQQGSFEAGGRVIGEPGRTLSCDHGHVEYQIPTSARPTALFLWHSSSASVWQRRWDGGEGFQTKLLRRGYPTYLWDGPRVGRANWGCESYPYEAAAGRDQANFGAWRFGATVGQFYPGVQFPTNDPAALEQAYRARYLEFDTVRNAQLESDAAAVALSRVGASVLLTNSAGGFRAILTALKSDNVKGIVAYENPGYVFPESAGPHREEGPFGPVYVSDAEFARLTKVPMQFVWGDNVADSASWAAFLELNREFVKLVNERGGKAEILMLNDAGLRGNTHIPFADLNNEEVAAQLFEWLGQYGF